MRRQVLVALLVPVVLADKVQVLAADHNGALHLGGDDGAGEDAAADGHVPGEGALFVNISAGDGLLGGLEAQANILEPAGALALGDDALVVQEDGVLLGEGAGVL